jgi:hypothetical protein
MATAAGRSAQAAPARRRAGRSRPGARESVPRGAGSRARGIRLESRGRGRDRPPGPRPGPRGCRTSLQNPGNRRMGPANAVAGYRHNTQNQGVARPARSAGRGAGEHITIGVIDVSASMLRRLIRLRSDSRAARRYRDEGSCVWARFGEAPRLHEGRCSDQVRTCAAPGGFSKAGQRNSLRVHARRSNLPLLQS